MTLLFISCMANILVKSGVEQLSWFSGKKYPYYEAYLRSLEDLPFLLHTTMALRAIHLPARLQLGSERPVVDFCDQGKVGEASFALLREVIQFAGQHKVKYIVIHLGFFDSLQQEREHLLSITGQKFAALPSHKVKLCVENVPHWITLSGENEPVISLPEHFLLFQRSFPQAAAVLDTDHLAITTVFNQFLDVFHAGYASGGFSKEKESAKEKMENHIAQAATKNVSYYAAKVQQALQHFLSIVQPALIHAVGSDFCQYRLVDSLPLVGEALPLGFRGVIKGFSVEDRIDHSAWISLLPAETDITLELYLRQEYDYLKQIEKNYRFLTEALSCRGN